MLLYKNSRLFLCGIPNCDEKRQKAAEIKGTSMICIGMTINVVRSFGGRNKYCGSLGKDCRNTCVYCVF